MKTPLILIDVPSIYKNKSGVAVSLPKRLASATPDMALAIARVSKELKEHQGRLVLSDLFRSFDMQSQAHLEHLKGNKKAFVAAPGGSFHEAGRAMDISLSDIKVPLATFWEVSMAHGLVPIIDKPNSKTSEAWHFECRGSHQKVIEYYKAGHGNNFEKAYTAGAASAILAWGGYVQLFGKNQKEAQLQAALIRCGHIIGNIDGAIGANTRLALKSLSIDDGSIDDALKEVEDLVQIQFAEEYRVASDVVAIQMENVD